MEASVTVWQRFRAWRRSRPFWGGVLTVLAGLELVGSMNLELAGGHISIGQEGFPAYLVAFTLIIAGPLAWAMPAQRHFYGLVACFVALYSLVGVNLGGFLAGMLLGIAGGGLIFAWTPVDPAPQGGDEDGGPGEVTPRHAAIGIIVLALSLSLLNVVVAPGSASAAPCATASASPAPPPPAGTGSGGLIGDFLEWLSKLLGGGHSKPSPTPSPTPKPSACPSPSASPMPRPPGSATPSVSATTRPKTSASPTSKAPNADAGQAGVGKRPSRLTGTRVTMVNLNFDGVVDLPTADGTIKVLKFSMSQSDTDDFLLHVYGPNGVDTELRTTKLTVRGGNVQFYTNRFRGNLFGLIPVEFTPTSLPPPIPLPLVFFTNPDIQLVFVHAPELLAPKLRINEVKA
jgi:hypothetical protein